MTDQKLWSTDDLAAYLGVTPGTVRKWRMQKKTPPELRVNGVVRYDPEAVRAWVKGVPGGESESPPGEVS